MQFKTNLGGMQSDFGPLQKISPNHDTDHRTQWRPLVFFVRTCLNMYLGFPTTMDMEHTDPVIARMHQQADQWECRGDLRFLFLRCYAIMSHNMLEALETGRFQDPVWVKGLLHHFADYYFDALQQYDGREDDTPAVWRQAHDASCTQDLHVMQHLLLGINAHINYDLVLSLYDELSPDWPVLDNKEREMRHQDHLLVNTIISETIDTVQDQVIKRQSPFMGLVDRMMGRVDEWLLSEIISGWRSDVWRETGRMLEARSPEQREEIRFEVEAHVMQKARQLLAY